METSIRCNEQKVTRKSARLAPLPHFIGQYLKVQRLETSFELLPTLHIATLATYTVQQSYQNLDDRDALTECIGFRSPEIYFFVAKAVRNI